MGLVDKYIYAVTAELPESIRLDVSNELQANIEDMLPDSASESDIRAILEKLGNPARLADEYNPSKRYLIGPAYYNAYISVLKLVVSIAVLVAAFTASIKEIISSTVGSDLVTLSAHIIGAIIAAIIEGAGAAFVWVTAVFVVIERSGVDEGKLPFRNRKWSPDDLPEVPTSNKQIIPRTETITSICFEFFFIVLSLSVYLNPRLISVYTKAADGFSRITPIFETDRIKPFILVFLMFSIVKLFILAWKFAAKRWSFKLVIVNAIRDLAICIFIYIALRDTSLINPRFFDNLAQVLGISFPEMKSGWFTGSMAFAALFTAVKVIDSVKGFIGCRKAI